MQIELKLTEPEAVKMREFCMKYGLLPPQVIDFALKALHQLEAEGKVKVNNKLSIN